jgi:hypothetical protein
MDFRSTCVLILKKAGSNWNLSVGGNINVFSLKKADSNWNFSVGKNIHVFRCKKADNNESNPGPLDLYPGNLTGPIKLYS